MNVKHAQGGFLPMLTDDSYKERKFDNLSYNYEAKFDHGSRPMHKTTFNLTQTNHNDNLTHNKIVCFYYYCFIYVYSKSKFNS